MAPDEARVGEHKLVGRDGAAPPSGRDALLTAHKSAATFDLVGVEAFVHPQVGLLAGVIFVRAKQLEAPAAASAPKADKPEEARLKSVSPK